MRCKPVAPPRLAPSVVPPSHYSSGLEAVAEGPARVSLLWPRHRARDPDVPPPVRGDRPARGDAISEDGQEKKLCVIAEVAHRAAG